MSEVRPGYKQTDVGEITEQIFLGELFISKPKDLSVSTDEMVTFLGMEDISVDGNIISQKLIKRDEIRAGLTAFAKNDVLVAKITPCFENGKGACLDTISTEIGYGSTEFHVLRPKSTACNRYIFYHTQSESLRKKLELEMVGTAGQKRVPLNAIEKYLLPVRHSFAEQTAIAEALSDTDDLIQGLDQLIAKKRNIKQGAMQELLTGKRRLPGFAGEWEAKPLHEIADVDCDNLGSSTNPDFFFKYVSLEDVNEGVLTGFSELIFRSAPSRARRRIQSGDILVSTVRPNLKAHLHFTVETFDWVCSTGFSVVRCKEGKAVSGFIIQHFFADAVSNQIEALLTGSNYPAINSKDVKGLIIPMPEVAEQTAIAAVLSDMDAEIAALEQKRDKYKAIKQGMMQELLTGKTRLV